MLEVIQEWYILLPTGTLTVCIMGGGHFEQFFLHGDYAKNRIAYQQMDCYNCNWVCKYESMILSEFLLIQCGMK